MGQGWPQAWGQLFLCHFSIAGPSLAVRFPLSSSTTLSLSFALREAPLCPAPPSAEGKSQKPSGSSRSVVGHRPELSPPCGGRKQGPLSDPGLVLEAAT